MNPPQTCRCKYTCLCFLRSELRTGNKHLSQFLTIWYGHIPAELPGSYLNINNTPIQLRTTATNSEFFENDQLKSFKDYSKTKGMKECEKKFPNSNKISILLSFRVIQKGNELLNKGNENYKTALNNRRLPKKGCKTKSTKKLKEKDETQVLTSYQRSIFIFI